MPKSQSGVALVYALLIMIIIMTTVLALTALVTNEVRMSVSITNSIGSFYTAESGIEKAMYYIKYGQQVGDFTKYYALDNSGSNNYIIGTSGDYNFDILTASTTALGYTAYFVTTSTPVHVNIINPSGNVEDINDYLTNNIEITADTYKVAWSINDCDADLDYPPNHNHAGDRLEITLTSFTDGFSDADVVTHVARCSCVSGSDDCNINNTTYSDLDLNKYYRFTFRPLDSTINQLDFNLYDGSTEVGISSEAEIVTNGNFHNSRYKLKARLPAISAASDIFSYVIFSEEPLIKDTD